jgi:hypothetical protein
MKGPLLVAVFVTSVLLAILVSSAEAVAPARPGQPYAESICNTDPNVIFCEDFNYPLNFGPSAGAVAPALCNPPGGTGGSNTWLNPGLTAYQTGYAYGCDGRRIHPAPAGSGYIFPTKPSGMMPSVTGCAANHVAAGCDHVFAANWQTGQGPIGAGSTLGQLRPPGGNYANGSPPATTWHIRFQLYFTPDFTWAGDGKAHPYNYAYSPCRDTKLIFFGGSNWWINPTSASIDAGFMAGCGIWSSTDNQRYADALVTRIGDAGTDAYGNFPLCSQCTRTPSHMEYGPYPCGAGTTCPCDGSGFSQNVAACWRNINQTPTPGKIFRMNTGKWYTIEQRYTIGSSGQPNGTVEMWVDGIRVYSASNLTTCTANGFDDCSGLGSFGLTVYHSDFTDPSNPGAPVPGGWKGQAIIDNLIISRAYIGPPTPTGGGPNPNPQPGVPGAVQVH